MDEIKLEMEGSLIVNHSKTAASNTTLSGIRKHFVSKNIAHVHTPLDADSGHLGSQSVKQKVESSTGNILYCT